MSDILSRTEFKLLMEVLGAMTPSTGRAELDMLRAHDAAMRAALAKCPCMDPVEAWNEDGSELLHREGCGRCDACEARKP